MHVQAVAGAIFYGRLSDLLPPDISILRWDSSIDFSSLNGLAPDALREVSHVVAIAIRVRRFVFCGSGRWLTWKRGFADGLGGVCSRHWLGPRGEFVRLLPDGCPADMLQASLALRTIPTPSEELDEKQPATPDSSSTAV